MFKIDNIWWNHSKIINDLLIFLFSSFKFLFSIKWYWILNSDFGYRAAVKRRTFKLWPEAKLMSKQWLEGLDLYFYSLIYFLYMVCSEQMYFWLYLLFFSNFIELIICMIFGSLLIVNFTYIICKIEFTKDIK